ncbi:MAG: CRISPR-associated helicase Cas3' [Eubacteriales bacterium]|nr:CRISPR-associated helicase Cas3' [Eubacteriales bacterium]
MEYVAHKNEKGEIQTVKEHSENVANLCKEFAKEEFKDICYYIGLLHDIGKYQETFQKRINGAKVKIEHSICGAKELEKIDLQNGGIKRLMQFCIACHHTGLCDGGNASDTEYDSTLQGRLKRESRDDYSYFKEELINFDNLKNIDFSRIMNLVIDGIEINTKKQSQEELKKITDKISFFIRYCFSCLVDADTIDTRLFCEGTQDETMESNFKDCLNKINEKIKSFVCISDLQKKRKLIQDQVYEKINKEAKIYLMNMPTGSGKTICSMKFALEKAIKSNKDHIIYIIPYNSIIDQTADVFENIFKESANILRHQSSFNIENVIDIKNDKLNDETDDYIKRYKMVTENWNANIIITTQVQFFESLVSNKRSALRKLHNMNNSILVFDEVHLMPIKCLKPCLEGIEYLLKYFSCEAIFLSATMPNIKKLLNQVISSDISVIDLIDDKTVTENFNKCIYKNIEEQDIEKIVKKARKYQSSLIVVNKRSTAREIYEKCNGKKYHLSTYMTSFDRKRIIDEIHKETIKLEKDYPNGDAPYDRKIIVVSTSLIEAGVDLDFRAVFREMSGLDNILQSGGRSNREGLRDKGVVYIFTITEKEIKGDIQIKANIAKPLIEKNKNEINTKKCIEDYYDKLYEYNKEKISQNTMSSYCSDKNIPLRIQNIPFHSYDLKIIDTRTISIFVAEDDNSKNIQNKIINNQKYNIKDLSLYSCSVYEKELEDLKKQNVIEERNGFFLLKNEDYYDKNIGIKFESKDYYV